MTLYELRRVVQPFRRQFHNLHIPDSHDEHRTTASHSCVPLPVLAGIVIRAIVETVCKEKGASGGNLEQKIDHLAAMNLITSDGARILHSLRVLGNKAAHEVKPHTQKELSVAFAVLEHLLQTVYIIPELAKKLPSA
jgi:hypothetical protein